MYGKNFNNKSIYLLLFLYLSITLGEIDIIETSPLSKAKTGSLTGIHSNLLAAGLISKNH